MVSGAALRAAWTLRIFLFIESFVASTPAQLKSVFVERRALGSKSASQHVRWFTELTSTSRPTEHPAHSYLRGPVLVLYEG